MSRPSDRRGHVLGALPRSAATDQHDNTLNGGSVNGAPDRIPMGSQLTSVLRLRCTCGAVVGVVWFCEPPAADPFFYADLQAVERPERRPVECRTVRLELRPRGNLLCDCPAHGRITTLMANVLAAARAHVGGESGQQMRTLRVKPDGLPVGHDLTKSEGMTIDETRRWLGWADSP